jgi:hypothetical protein
LVSVLLGLSSEQPPSRRSAIVAANVDGNQLALTEVECRTIKWDPIAVEALYQSHPAEPARHAM